MAEVPLWLHPALALVLGAVVVVFVDRRIADVVVLAAPVVALGLVVAASGGVAPTVELYGYTLEPLRADRLATAFAGIFAVAALLANLYGLSTTTRVERAAGLVTAGAAIGVALAGDLVTLWWWWEVKALSTAAVIAVGSGANARRAAMRYLGVHLIGGSALLAGIAWHVGAGGGIAADALGLSATTALIAVGFLINAAVPPLHAWLPDAYPKASVAGSVLLSSFTTKAAVYALARTFPGEGVLVWLGVAMALYGVVFAMVQDDLRQLLCYHIVSQVGFMVAAVGVGTDAAINGATAHAIAHIIYKALLLMGVGAVIHATGRTVATRLGGLASALPWVLAAYLVGAVSISGVPLFSGFVSKELSIAALSDAGLGWAVIGLKIASVGTVLSTLGKLPYATWLAPPATDDPPVVRRQPAASMYAAMGVAAGCCLAIGVAPSLLWDQLPAAAAYSPFTLAKLVETAQILGAACLGFWLLRDRLVPHAGVVLDVDRLYRRVPRLVTATSASPPAASGDRERIVPGATRLRGVALHPSWLLGTVLLVAAVAVVVGGVWR